MAAGSETFDPRHGEAVTVREGVRRVVAGNEGPFTFRGTNTYLLGEQRLAIVDPGPDDPRHRAALIAAVGGRPVEAILVTHSHRDHSDGAPALAALLDAPLMGCALLDPPSEGGGSDAGLDRLWRPDRVLRDGERLTLGDTEIEVVATPGHLANHLCFALSRHGALLSGDHVMGWSTTVIVPPLGSMADYMASLDRVMGRDEALYLPGHGDVVRDGPALARHLKAHRRMRERGIVARLRAGDATIAAIVAATYRDVDPRLHAAAAQSTLAQLLWMVDRGDVDVIGGGAATLDSAYRLSAGVGDDGAGDAEAGGGATGASVVA